MASMRACCGKISSSQAITATAGNSTAFSILNVWIVSAVRSRVAADDGSGWALARAASAAAVVLLLYPSTVDVLAPYAFPSPLIGKVAESILGPAEIRNFEDCDPTWRSVLTGTGG
jgi:hypothetical protein